MKLFVVILIAIIASAVLAGGADQTIVNILIGEGYADEQITEIIGMVEFPTFDKNGRLLGNQKLYSHKRRKLVVLSFDSTSCYVTTVIYDHSGKKP